MKDVSELFGKELCSVPRSAKLCSFVTNALITIKLSVPKCIGCITVKRGKHLLSNTLVAYKFLASLDCSERKKTGVFFIPTLNYKICAARHKIAERSRIRQWNVIQQHCNECKNWLNRETNMLLFASVEPAEFNESLWFRQGVLQMVDVRQYSFGTLHYTSRPK